MATIVNNPNGPSDRIVERSDSGGWAVAVIILLAVLVVGGFVWMRYYGTPAPAPQTNTADNTPGSANINITLPADQGGAGSGDGAGTGASSDTNTEAPTPNSAQ